MAKHVWVDQEWHLGGLPDTLDEAMEADGADWPAALGNEHVGIFGVIASQLAERPHLVTADRVHAGNPVLDAVNVKAALGQFDLLPLQVADLRGPQTVAIGGQDHGRVAMPIAAVLTRAVHQALDLALGEIAPLDCQVYDAWCAFLGCRFHADKLCLRVSYCICYTHFLHSRKGRSGCMERIAMAMQDGGAGAGARHEAAARAARPTSFCLAAEPL